MAASNSESVRASFARQAKVFEDGSMHFARHDVATWMAQNTLVESDDVVLEVAAGTALYGRAIAAAVRAVVALDVTPEMLRKGKEAAEASGLQNLVFQLGDATELPFLDATFDRVISRLAIHHLSEPQVALEEMVRVCRPSGSVSIIDMVTIDEADAVWFNDLERLRDPAHVSALSRSELERVARQAGLRIIRSCERDTVIDADRWLEQTGTGHEATAILRSAWNEEMDGGQRTGMRPHRVDGRLQLIHTWILMTGVLEERSSLEG